jgi:hypothetical protein
MSSPQLSDQARKQRLIALWQQRFLPEERTEARVQEFCRWLLQNHPQLLKSAHDPCQQLKRELGRFIRPESE